MGHTYFFYRRLLHALPIRLQNENYFLKWVFYSGTNELISPWGSVCLSVRGDGFCALKRLRPMLSMGTLAHTESTSAQVMAWCHQAPSHCLSQCWLIMSVLVVRMVGRNPVRAGPNSHQWHGKSFFLIIIIIIMIIVVIIIIISFKHGKRLWRFHHTQIS